MNRSKLTLAVAILAVSALATSFAASNAVAQTGPGTANQYCRYLDDDGDGIPNCLDPDYTPPLDGTGYQFGRGEIDPACAGGQFSALQRLSYKWSWMWSWIIGGGATRNTTGFGPGDGTGYDHDGPHDGTGYGAVVMRGYAPNRP